MAKLRNAGFILIAVLFLALSWGCTSDILGANTNAALENGGDNIPGTFEGLSAELEERILQDYFDAVFAPISEFASELTLNDFFISQYFGTYNGAVVVRIRMHYSGPVGIPGVNDVYTIAGIQFHHGPISPILVWENGQFFGGTYFRSMGGTGLRTAYNLGFLTRDDLRCIADRSHGIDMSRIGKFEEIGLSAELELQIFRDFMEISLKATPLIAWVAGYFGTYDGSVAVWMENDNGSFHDPSPFWCFNSDGKINFIRIIEHNAECKGIFIWNEGGFYCIVDAYKQGLLALDDVMEIHEKFQTQFEGLH